MNKAEEFWKENAIYSGTVLLNPVKLMEAYHQSEVNAISDDYIQKKSLEILELTSSEEYKNKEYIHEMHKMIIECLKTNY